MYFAVPRRMEKTNAIKALVVDPDKDFCNSMKLYLEDSYFIYTSQKVDDLKTIILRYDINILIIGSDYAVHYLVEMIRDLKKSASSLKIIVMYNYLPNEKELAKMLIDYSDDHISKPFDVHLLKEKVERLTS
jgi:DNA-binding response OmpR family regulator